MIDPMMRMYISFGGMGALVLSAVLILLARHKLYGFFRVIISILAYSLLIVGSLIIFFIVFSGPTPE
ncbi:DUF2768 domain-containing protein [Piscibacillus sp. B03]|uniref:DUF2768 domain-containing protein n=1 Tax=Piscibacillus sp. B03 TaxID=3457430 RepID=UPI003FCD9F8D